MSGNLLYHKNVLSSPYLQKPVAFSKGTSNKASETSSLKGAHLNTLFASLCQLNFALIFIFPTFYLALRSDLRALNRERFFITMPSIPFTLISLVKMKSTHDPVATARGSDTHSFKKPNDQNDAARR